MVNIILKWLHDVYRDLCLVCWFTFLCALFIWTSICVMIVLITHTIIFSKKEVLSRQAALDSSGESESSWEKGKCLKGTVMQIEKPLISGGLRVLKVS